MRTSVCVLALSCLAFVSGARAQAVQVAQPPSAQIIQTVPPQPQYVEYVEASEPRAFRHAFQGLLAGSLVGTGIGYLSIHGTDVDEPWRDIVLGAGIGALTGTGLGLTMGLLDASDDGRSAIRYVMRDALYGTLLGGLFGSVAGGLVALDSDDAEDVLVGASIGSIGGVVLGGLVGVIEGQFRPRLPARKLTTTIVVSQDSAGQRVLLPSVRGSF